MSDKPNSFQDLLSRATSKDDDQYSLDKFEGPKKESRLRIKYNRIKNTLVGKEGVSDKLVMGFKMGFTVGGIFGALTGCLAYYQTRNILYIPLSIITVGGSFGFFMGVGTVVRTEDGTPEPALILTQRETGEWVTVTAEPEWKAKFTR